jgi:hypothetical protein
MGWGGAIVREKPAIRDNSRGRKTGKVPRLAAVAAVRLRLSGYLERGRRLKLSRFAA